MLFNLWINEKGGVELNSGELGVIFDGSNVARRRRRRRSLFRIVHARGATPKEEKQG